MGVFHVSAETLRELGWPELLEHLASRTQSAVGREYAADLQFLESRESIEERLDQVEELRALHRAELSSPHGDIADIRDIVLRLERSAILSGSELMVVAVAIERSSRVRSFFHTHRLLAPSVAAIASAIPRLSPIARRLSDALEASGALRDTASDALGEYRRRARALHRAIQQKIQTFVDDPDYAEVLQDRYFSVRNDRYVVPVVSSFRSRMPGIVHNASGTGQTLFVEPEAIIGLGNDLSIALSLVAEEEERIRAELSMDLAHHALDLRELQDRTARIDFLEAAASLSDDLDAHRPVIEEGQEFVLPEARHPLLVLQGKSVVANSLALTSEQRALVVSGPNAGGKTVTISTLAFAALLARAGFPVAGGAGCRVPLFGGVASVIGDAQDLSRDLSTFSAHLSRLSEILTGAGSNWLVLIDEIAADTDPTEGAALAVAVLEVLVDRQIRVAVTTHLDDVKAVAIGDRRFVNARLVIDGGTLRPTYHLQLGTAGISNALAMAEHVGLPPEVIERARRHLSEGSKLSVALAALEEERQELERVQQQFRDQREALDFERRAMTEERARLAEARRDAKRSVYAELDTELHYARTELSATIAQIQRSADMRRAQKLQREVETLDEKLLRDRQKLEADTVAASEAQAQGATDTQHKPLAVGSRVRVSSLGQNGEILDISGSEATVMVGSLRTRVKLDTLVGMPLAPAAGTASPRDAGFGRGQAGSQQQRARQVAAAELDHPDGRLDIRGMRVDEARRRLEDFVDRLVLKGPPVAVVIHGHGAGVLRRLVREVLDELTDVTAYRPGGRSEGGEGVTVFEVG